jgi:hypothetical protein
MSVATSDRVVIEGHVSRGFERVREAFAENFERRHELAGACCAYHRGVKVVDLWGGVRNKQTADPWEAHTMVIVHSATKGLAAMTMAIAHSRGRLARLCGSRCRHRLRIRDQPNGNHAGRRSARGGAPRRGVRCDCGSLSRYAHARAFPENGLLLERPAIRLDEGQNRLPRGGGIGMDKQQHLGLLVIDAPSGCPPLALRFPDGQPVGKPIGHLVTQENLPLELADGALRPREPEIQRRAELRSGRRAAVRDRDSLRSDRGLQATAGKAASGEDHRADSDRQ